MMLTVNTVSPIYRELGCQNSFVPESGHILHVLRLHACRQRLAYFDSSRTRRESWSLV